MKINLLTTSCASELHELAPSSCTLAFWFVSNSRIFEVLCSSGKIPTAWDQVLKRLSMGPTCAKARVSHVTHHAKGIRVIYYFNFFLDTDANVAILVSAAPVNAIGSVCDACSSDVYSVVHGIVHSVVDKMRTVHRISWRHARMPSAENLSALQTHGKRCLHVPSSGMFHAVPSLPMSSFFPENLKIQRNLQQENFRACCLWIQVV
ncbi:hypothetical protein Y032_0631g866 [Ancylostoma ceylanicum]|nr:hypothetical protein Y032_0631g866 [Ancylostoma ceylanicum]